jgi:hypothetical protein
MLGSVTANIHFLKMLKDGMRPKNHITDLRKLKRFFSYLSGKSVNAWKKTFIPNCGSIPVLLIKKLLCKYVFYVMSLFTIHRYHTTLNWKWTNIRATFLTAIASVLQDEVPMEHASILLLLPLFSFIFRREKGWRLRDHAQKICKPFISLSIHTQVNLSRFPDELK